MEDPGVDLGAVWAAAAVAEAPGVGSLVALVSGWAPVRVTLRERELAVELEDELNQMERVVAAARDLQAMLAERRA